MEIRCKCEDGKLFVELQDVIRDDSVLRQLAKTAIFDEYLIEGVGKLMVHGAIEWHDDETYNPWYSVWSGRGATFEKARRIFAGMAGRIAGKLIADLTDERDKLFTAREEWQRKCWRLENDVRELQSQLRRATQVSAAE